MRPAWLDMILDGPADPERLAPVFPWAQAMIGAPRDPVYHAEGDPWTHSAMVAAALERGEGFAELSPERQEVQRLAAWFHDCAKPMTTVFEWDEEQKRERIRQPGHALLGATIAWQALIDGGYDVLKAREVHALVLWHMRPGHMLEGDDALRKVIRFSESTQLTTWEDLLRFCRSDRRGRISLKHTGDDLEDLDLLEMFIAEEGANVERDLLTERWPFASAEARLRYLRTDGEANPFFTPPEPKGSRMVLMSGLPGSGKDTLVKRHFGDLPVVSLDDLRAELDVDPKGNQGRVIQAGLEAAKVHLRARRDFVWNTTGLSRLTRGKIIGIARGYDARVEAVSVDVPLDLAQARNARRSEPVLRGVIEKLGRKREPVGVDEAHALWSANAEGEIRLVFGEIQEALLPEVMPAI